MEIPDARRYGSEQPKSERPSPFVEPPIAFDFEDLREPTLRILEGIKPHIDAGSYRMIIGDDASGRIPTLLLSGVIKNAYLSNQYEPPAVRFFAGDRFNKDEAFVANLAERFASDFTDLGIHHGARVLVVTDTINTGAALRPLVTQLARHQIPYDIASIGFVHPTGLGSDERQQYKDKILDSLGGSVYVGQDKVPSSVYRNPHAAGVARERNNPVAIPAVGTLRGTTQGSPYMGQSVTQEHINAARDAVARLVEEISSMSGKPDTPPT